MDVSLKVSVKQIKIASRVLDHERFGVICKSGEIECFMICETEPHLFAERFA